MKKVMNQHKRLAQGEKVTGRKTPYKAGGVVKTKKK
jgi:hypothetical protein